LRAAQPFGVARPLAPCGLVSVRDRVQAEGALQ